MTNAASNLRYAMGIMQESTTKRGFVSWGETDEVADHLTARGLLTRSVEVKHVEARPLWYNCQESEVPAHDASVYTYRATESGREAWLLGAILV